MNLIVCITPLQVLIACQIIARTKQHPRTQACAFTGLYLPYGVNANSAAKHRYYFAKLQAACDQAAFVELKNQGIAEQLTTLDKLKTTLQQLAIWQQPIDTVYLASIDVLFVQYVVSKVRFTQLMTFDDGTANIFPNSTYFNPVPKSLVQRVFKRAVGIRYPSVAAILAISAKHYSIFANEKNIVDNVEVIQLFDTDTNTDTDDTQTPSAAVAKPLTRVTKVKKILLGQGLDAFIGEHAYLQLLTESVQRFGITEFVPHPREQLDVSASVKVIHSDKIVEDYLLDELQTHPDTEYEIYTFFSTAVFSLRDFPRTRVVLLRHAALQQQFSEAYQFLISRGFDVIDMDNNFEHGVPL